MIWTGGHRSTASAGCRVTCVCLATGPAPAPLRSHFVGKLKKLGEPWLLASVGGIVAVGAAVLALVSLADWATALGAVAAVFAIALTYLIARRQGKESERLEGTVVSVENLAEDTHVVVTGIRKLQEEAKVQQAELLELQKQSSDLLREVAERASAQDYEPVLVEDEPTPSESESESAQPSAKPDWEEAAITRLKAKGADLDFGSLQWKRKMPKPPLPGNHGWFVESPGGNSRWFLRKARGMTVRKAMPRDFLDQLEREQAVDPRTIALDYQLSQHGLAAWYARTYAGDLYRVTRPNRSPGQPIRTERVDEEAG